MVQQIPVGAWRKTRLADDAIANQINLDRVDTREGFPWDRVAFSVVMREQLFRYGGEALYLNGYVLFLDKDMKVLGCWDCPTYAYPTQMSHHYSDSRRDQAIKGRREEFKKFAEYVVKASNGTVKIKV